MGRAGQALKQVLANYGISQNKVAVTLGVERGSVYRWVHEIRDPTAERVYQIVLALKHLNPAAAKEFVRLYLGEVVEDIDGDSS
ncbi:MAG: helix-turn-helix transcriptional regulator [Cyanobacteriota bacterium]|nr:helix-turn-helix transcriptional regulator [Cyanobacteriota bacterium]